MLSGQSAAMDANIVIVRNITDAHHFLSSPAGGIDFGDMPPSLAAKSGTKPEPIRRQNGYPGPDGFGNLHVIHYLPRRRQIETLGFASFAQVAHSIATAYQHIYAGKQRGRYQLACHPPGYSDFIGVERLLAEPGWTIITRRTISPHSGNRHLVKRQRGWWERAHTTGA